MGSNLSINLDSPDVQFQQLENLDAAAREEIGKGNLGQVLSISDDGRTVQTQYGRITFSGPVLDSVKGKISVGDFINAGKNLETVNSNVRMDVYIMMALFHALGAEMRESSRHERHVARDAQMTELQVAADKMREAAGMALAAGIVSGVFQMGAGIAQGVGGILSVVGGGVGLGQLKGLSGKSDAEISKGVEQVKNMTAIFSGVSSIIGGFGQVGEGVGKGISSGLNFGAEQFRAEQKEHEAYATKSETLSQDENEMMQNMKDMIKTIQEKLQSMEQTRHETMKNILRA